MKLPTAEGVITILGNQESRKYEGNTAYTTKNVHAIEAAEAEEEDDPVSSKPDEACRPEGVTPAEHTKKVPLCEDVPY